LSHSSPTFSPSPEGRIPLAQSFLLFFRFLNH
jgi:hypothetical protein